MPGTGQFGLFKLGTANSEVTLPALTEFREDPVRQGFVHTLLNGKARADEFGERKHFFLAWEGLTSTEYATVESAWNASGVLTLLTPDGSYTVCRGNHGPKEVSHTGYYSTNIELEES